MMGFAPVVFNLILCISILEPLRHWCLQLSLPRCQMPSGYFAAGSAEYLPGSLHALTCFACLIVVLLASWNLAVESDLIFCAFSTREWSCGPPWNKIKKWLANAVQTASVVMDYWSESELEKKATKHTEEFFMGDTWLCILRVLFSWCLFCTCAQKMISFKICLMMLASSQESIHIRPIVKQNILILLITITYIHITVIMWSIKIRQAVFCLS